MNHEKRQKKIVSCYTDGIRCYGRGDYPGAEGHLRRALKMAPQDSTLVPVVVKELAATLVASGRFVETLRVVRPIVTPAAPSADPAAPAHDPWAGRSCCRLAAAFALAQSALYLPLSGAAWEAALESVRQYLSAPDAPGAELLDLLNAGRALFSARYDECIDFARAGYARAVRRYGCPSASAHPGFAVQLWALEVEAHLSLGDQAAAADLLAARESGWDALERAVTLRLRAEERLLAGEYADARTQADAALAAAEETWRGSDPSHPLAAALLLTALRTQVAEGQLPARARKRRARVAALAARLDRLEGGESEVVAVVIRIARVAAAQALGSDTATTEDWAADTAANNLDTKFGGDHFARLRAASPSLARKGLGVKIV